MSKHFESILINYFIKFKDAFRERFKLMEIASRKKLLDDMIIHLSIHDAVLHSQRIDKKVQLQSYFNSFTGLL